MSSPGVTQTPSATLSDPLQPWFWGVQEDTLFITSGTRDKYLYPSAPPLTTLFTAPAFCHSRWLAYPDGSFLYQVYNAITMTGDGTPSDPVRSSCRPFGAPVSVYSPGVCPEGETLLGITRYQYSAAKKLPITTLFNGLCCPSGFLTGVGGTSCRSSVLTPLTVSYPVTYIHLEGMVGSSSRYTTSYEWDASYTLTSGTITSAVPTNNITTLTKGTAFYDAISVAWQLEDLDSFPTAYAASLAQKIGVP
ncbi:hypothetical protein BDV95DRAFT_589210 [Massariosphaeria phaeospora]|uniref:Uncharacterized protein n=1 Tax=Massariosphaeria phaeospora TaxID=100035 RepID=A0A7C8IFP7_9PLEO|nr:hypothetical protein BDV95DRAFT_589210 [Massariosphaeria phaeospora]